MVITSFKAETAIIKVIKNDDVKIKSKYISNSISISISTSTSRIQVKVLV